MMGRLLRKPLTWLALAVMVAGAGFGLYWFQPWTLVVDQQVDEALSTPVAVAPDPTADPGTAGEPAGAAEPAGPALLSEAEFISHKHTTTGTARIIRDVDGSHRLELVDLDTSNGPDLLVWITDQPVLEGEEGWHVFDDGEWVELDRLRGNRGNQVYDIPDNVDPADFTSVSIWCKRFSVSFGAAPLNAG